MGHKALLVKQPQVPN